MKKEYVKPVVEMNEEFAEGVYMASGDGQDTCYTTTARICQKIYGGYYCIQVNGKHHADHTKEAQTLHISFNLPVEYVSSGGSLASGNNSNTLKINYHYHQNPIDNIGLGDLVVKAECGLSITNVYFTD